MLLVLVFIDTKTAGHTQTTTSFTQGTNNTWCIGNHHPEKMVRNSEGKSGGDYRRKDLGTQKKKEGIYEID